jgi:predicted Zn finger-like uncharacterized protein
MIITCAKCRTKYRFDDSLMTGNGLWMRCSTCQHEFFEPNPLATDQLKPPEKPAPEPAFEESKPQEPAKAMIKQDVALERVAAEMPAEKEKINLWTPAKIIGYLIAVTLVVGAVYLWVNPQIGREVLDMVYPGMADDILGKDTRTESSVPAGGINFTDVRERFMKNWIFGDILVIQGMAVNEYDYGISKVKLRGKILDSTGKIVGEVESYGGNILTDEELGNLTDQEIMERLSRAEGSTVPNTAIAPKATIPFMIVFINPPKEVDEFIIELAGSERPTS